MFLMSAFPLAGSFELTYRIKEEIPIGTPIGNLGQDSNISRLLSQQDFNTLNYSLLPYPQDDVTLLTLDAHLGVVRSADRIDRERLCPYVTRCTLSLHVSARTKSGQQYHTFDVLVLVEDINDNSPTFEPSSLAVTLDEDVARFSSIPISHAVDEDIGKNGLQSYVLETPNDKFGLKVTRNLDNSLVPELYVKSPLNREEQAFYQLYVLAQDGGTPQLSGKLQVNVTLRDVNDNGPRFLETRYKVNVTETTPKGSRILKLEAEDIDVGVNGNVTSLVSSILTYGCETWTLLAHTERRVQAFENKCLRKLLRISYKDHVTNESVRELVVAYVGPQEPLLATVKRRKLAWFGHVTRHDSLSKTILQGTVEGKCRRGRQRKAWCDNIKEWTGMAMYELVRSASDRDAWRQIPPTTPQVEGLSEFRLGLRQREEIFRVFRVAPYTGHVVTLQDLTSFQDRTFTLIVEAVDGGLKPMSAQAEVIVNVIDSINDAPAIRMTLPAGSKVSVVNEDVRRGFVVGHFLVDDSDTGSNGEVTCYLDRSTRLGSLAAEAFGLQILRSYEYKVTVYRPLDRETTPSYQVTIICRDNGSPQLSTNETFSVVLQDVNDFAPQFTLPVWPVKIAENSHNENVVTLEATDRDLGRNKVVRYGLGNVTSLVSTYIEVDPDTGRVTTRKPLDRELFATLNFQVVATDTGDPPMSSTARVVITVLDQNDNYPRVPLGYSLSVSENSPPWTVVGQIEALDPDEGAAGEVIYQLMSDNEATKLFNLTQSGLLRTLRNFDREHRDLYDINVLASDSAPTNPLTNMLHIRVRIADDNDHEPEFRFPRAGNSTTVTSTDARVNATLGYLIARDPDSGENGTLHYTVLDDGGLDILRVDHATGRMYTSRNLRVRDVGEHQVTVFVRDLGVPPLTCIRHLLLVVQPGNASLAAQGSDSGMGRREHIIIVAVLVVVTLSIALCVLLVFLRVFRRDARAERLKYADGFQMGTKNGTPTPESAGLRALCNGEGAGPGEKGDTWRQYNTVSGPGGVTYDVEDDVIMFKLKLAEQYRELEPEDKVSVSSWK
ncbi:protocadherin-11 X-linked [Elysia marginata]|uniref:Protocadherin-11 X-linked n=1 Tax=Elysia marginata TaxID=1093978 RepID=A0AAV4EUJ6_9GAST|nr:protocadherin-11 X-linked [Elysia marginata]